MRDLRFIAYKGIKKGLPIIIGYIPIAMAFGVVAAQAHLPLLSIVLMSALVYAGASQFMAVQMVVNGAAGIEIVLATFILNLRHLIMGLSLMNKLESMPTRWKSILSFWLTDEGFAVASIDPDPDSTRPAYIIGLFLPLYGLWVTGTFVGAILYKLIPASISGSMTIGLYAMFIGLLVPAVRKYWRVGIIALVSMMLCYIVSLYLSGGWAIVLATIFASLVGIFVLEEDQK